MTDAEELELLELEAKAKNWKVGTAPVAAPPEEMPLWKRALTGEGFSTGSGDALKGAKASLDKAALGIKGLLPQGVQDAGDWVDKQFGGAGLTKETAVQVPDSTAGKTGAIATDIGMGLAPGGAVLRGAQALKAIPAIRALPGAISSIMSGSANVAGNAAAAAAMEPEDRGTAALWGGGGAAAGGAAARVLGGPLRTAMTPEAKVLADKDIYLTPGQMVSGEKANWMARALRGAEDKIGSIPFVGDVIKHGQEKSIKSFGLSEVNDALSHVGGKVKEAGASGIAEAHDLISKSYDNVLPYIKVPAMKGLSNVADAIDYAKNNIDLFDAGHASKLETFVDRAITPLLEKGDIGGSAAKKMDARIGELARRQMASEGNRPLGEAFQQLQVAWRDAMEGTTKEAKQVLQGTNAAFRKLLPLEAASETSAAGVFTPGQARKAALKLKMEPSEANAAARQVLPSTVPDSGTAGRQILHSILTPTAAAGAAGTAAAGGLAPALLGTAALAAGAYTRPGSKYLAGGVLPVVNALRGNKMSAQELEDITRLLATQGVRATGTGD